GSRALQEAVNDQLKVGWGLITAAAGTLALFLSSFVLFVWAVRRRGAAPAQPAWQPQAAPAAPPAWPPPAPQAAQPGWVTRAAPPAAQPIAPGWYPDPRGIAPKRWWDGQQWTDHMAT